MDVAKLIETHPTILTECAVSERLRRIGGVESHSTLFHTPLIYEEEGAKVLAEIYGEYRQTAAAAGLPLLLFAPTWRVDRLRVSEAGYDHRLLHDAVGFMQRLAQGWHTATSPLAVGALMAPMNDCYRPDQAPPAAEARSFHSWQANHLAEAGADCIATQTVPAVSEALGMAQALAEVGKPYIISFVIDRTTRVLDGTPLAEAMDRIDSETAHRPLGYMVNCVYPTFLRPEQQPPGFFRRLIGIQANSSSLDHDQLDGAESLQRDDPADWAARMLELNRRYGVKILGGCCGTDNGYLRRLAGL